ncbi:DnaJ domain containing protein [Melia azedarach]|uniref:DnaJ domain containing protein n=1 Tax=Melia azedarach TaxID=155640 RepID=A0ACC1Y0S6_MELAZ|nr:DnaJ domain containing protein [Melia azedarach]
MSSQIKKSKSTNILLSLLVNKDAEACREMAEEFFRQKNVDFALCSIETARLKNPNLPCLKSYFAAYMVNKLAVETKSWYAILGVKDRQAASVQEIKKHYDALSFLLRADIFSSVAAESANKLIKEAWEVLSNERRREAYDMLMGYTRVDDDGKLKSQTAVNKQYSSAKSAKGSPPEAAAAESSSSSISPSGSPSFCVHNNRKVVMPKRKGEHTRKEDFIVRKKPSVERVREVIDLNSKGSSEEEEPL